MAIQEWLQGLMDGAAGPWELAAVLVVATLLTEDATCVAAGLLAAAGKLPLPLAVGACALGIYLGDLALYWIGRASARGLLRWKWVRHRLPSEGGSRWRGLFDRRGVHILMASRFLPGTRLATYLTAGAIGWSFPRFALILGGAVLLWTPIVVGLATVVGDAALGWLDALGVYGWLVLLPALVLAWLAVRTLPLLCTTRGRRILFGRWLRLTRFEYASRWLVYTPVVLSLVWRWFTRGRCFTDAPCLFTACNPGIPHGGIVGESKGAILDQLPRAVPWGQPEPAVMVARYARLRRDMPLAERLAEVGRWLARTEGGKGPIVLKPDAGERGSGVALVRDLDSARAWLSTCPQDGILQEYVGGEEFGVVWRRVPDGDGTRGEVRSIARKVPPTVTGDGRSTLGDLILGDRRHVAMAGFHLQRHGDHADRVPAAGERVSLGELGTHCRGAAFLDARGLATPALAAALDHFMAGCPGLDFGRFDLRVLDDGALRRGKGLRILEFNGVTGEPAHIHDPGGSWWRGVRDLCGHWWAAAATGTRNRDAGHQPTPGPALLRHAIRSRSREDFDVDGFLPPPGVAAAEDGSRSGA